MDIEEQLALARKPYADKIMALEAELRLAREPDDSLTTISFQPEAHESAANAFVRLQDWVVHVVPVAGEPFDAVVHVTVFDRDTGHALVVLHPWDEEAGVGDPSREVRLDIYSELQRVEVI